MRLNDDQVRQYEDKGWIVVPGVLSAEEIGVLESAALRVLERRGPEVAREEDGKQGILRVTLKYTADRTPVITGIRRVSKPSLRVYTGKREVRLVRSGLGISIVTTSKGVMTDRQARRENVGGEVLCEVW